MNLTIVFFPFIRTFGFVGDFFTMASFALQKDFSLGTLHFFVYSCTYLFLDLNFH